MLASMCASMPGAAANLKQQCFAQHAQYVGNKNVLCLGWSIGQFHQPMWMAFAAGLLINM